MICQKETLTHSMRTKPHVYLVKVPGTIRIAELSLILETSIIPKSKYVFWTKFIEFGTRASRRTYRVGEGVRQIAGANRFAVGNERGL